MSNKRYDSWEEFINDCKIEILKAYDREIMTVTVVPNKISGIAYARFDMDPIMSWRGGEREAYRRIASVLARQIEKCFGSYIKPSY